MTDLYENTISKYRGSPAIVIIFLLSVIMFGIGINHFIEDTYSSYYGLLNLESTYALNVQIFEWSYWTMSIAPQVASMIFTYIFLSNTKIKWPLWVALASQGMDFFADSWYRGNGNLFQSWDVFVISSLITFIYFSIGSEFFVSVGAGLIIKLIAPAIQTWKANIGSIGKAARGEYRPPESSGGGDKHSKGGGRADTRPLREPKTMGVRPEIAERMGMRREGDIRPEPGMTPVNRAQMGGRGGNSNGDGGSTGEFSPIPR